ncbi:hypothetical protein MD484_g5209, partial [Candolleomyces efflorescens]
MAMISVQNLAIVQSSLVGDSKGNQFNDIQEVVGFPASMTINASHPLSKITLMHGGVVDGIEIEYAMDDGQTTKVSHGTSTEASNPGLNKSTVTLADRENIVAISGIHGSCQYGIRVSQLSFAIYDSGSGQMRIAGPFGGAETDSPQRFHVTANGTFVAFGGFAVNTNTSLGQLKPGQNGGLYGLTFFDIAYRSV